MKGGRPKGSKDKVLRRTKKRGTYNKVDITEPVKTWIEPVLCAHFGCKTKLSLVEQLCGSRCLQHMNIKKQTISLNV